MNQPTNDVPSDTTGAPYSRGSPDARAARATVRSALVAGGTGLVGGYLLRLLGEDPRYHRITSLVRRAATALPGVDLQVVDFERLEEFLAPQVADAFCCLGTTRQAAGSAAAFRRVDFDYIVAFAQLAMRAGASRFMLFVAWRVIGVAVSSTLAPRASVKRRAIHVPSG